MKFDTLGSRENPAILMIHGMFCNADMVKRFAQYMQDDYYIILPTLSGHYEGSDDYESKEAEAKAILHYLHEQGITKLAMLQGTSTGAEVALEFARICDIEIQHYFYDGGPFFDFPRWFKSIMRKKFDGFVSLVNNKTTDEAREALMNNSFVKALIGKNSAAYEGALTDFCEVGRHATKKSVKNVVETCYACKLPSFDEETQRRFIFLFSAKEPARKSEKRLKKQYPYAEYRIVEGYGHGGLQIAEPQKYADCLKDILK